MPSTNPPTIPDPHAEYTRRLAARRSEKSRLERRHVVLGNAKLALVALELLLLWLVFGLEAVSWMTLALPLMAFLPLIVVHENVLRDRRRAASAIEHYERGLARLEDRWLGTGPRGDRFLLRDHPYARDLDLFGEGSLFQILCQARTQRGEETLAAWLLSPAKPEEIRGRQQAISELKPALDLREDVATLAAEVEIGVRADELIAWCTAPPVSLPSSMRAVTWILTALALLAAGSWATLGTGVSPLLAVVMMQAIFRLGLRRRLQHMASATDRAATDLKLLAQILKRLEQESFETPLLQHLREQLESQGAPPSRWIRRLDVLVDCYEARRNQLFAPLGFVLLWDVHFALAIESWRRSVGPMVPRWLDSVGTFEALGSLAGYAFERPTYPFPELTAAGPIFDGVELGHPLLPRDRCVGNDVRLDSELRLLIVSGSNMSGKSTLVRAVGSLAVLAQAGAPVRAQRLRLSPLAVGASIGLQDSLQSGASHFYAEVQRLRQIVGLTDGQLPLLFLIDEVFQGTNSHDRRIGVEAVMRSLVARGAIGIITTHDLALTALAQSLAPHALNVHFQDDLQDGKMVFDYRIRPGVVSRSNALGLMRSVGLEV